MVEMRHLVSKCPRLAIAAGVAAAPRGEPVAVALHIGGPTLTGRNRRGLDAPFEVSYPKTMLSEGYFFVADLLGFGNIIQNLPEERVRDRVEQWVDLVQRATEVEGIVKFRDSGDTAETGLVGGRAWSKVAVDAAA